MREGKIVGIISRSNLVRALSAVAGGAASEVGTSDDRAIRAKLLTELQQQQWAAKLWAQDIIVSDGVVHLWFGADEPEERCKATRVAAENIFGVRAVEEHIVPVPLLPAF